MAARTGGVLAMAAVNQRRYVERRKMADPTAWAKYQRAKAQVWKVRNRDKVNAHEAVRKAIRKGLLIKPDLCEGCGVRGELHGHHNSYEQPLVVQWLCRICHKKVH